MRELLNRQAYLEYCSRHRHRLSETLPIYGIILVVVLCMIDLVLTLLKIAEGSFVDANPIAQSMIESGFCSGLVLLKLYAISIFGWVCTRNRHLLVTKVGIATAAVAYILLMFRWALVF